MLIGGINISRIHVELWHMHKVWYFQSNEIAFQNVLVPANRMAKVCTRKPLQGVLAQHADPRSSDADISGLSPVGDCKSSLQL